MSEAPVTIKLECKLVPFGEYSRHMSLTIYRSFLGWRRFLLSDWWRLKLRLPIK